MKLNLLLEDKEETEETFLDMLRIIINKSKSELENEKKSR